MQTTSSYATTFEDPEYVHPVLIAGAGPAGTLLAFCLAKMGVRPLIVDSNPFTDHEYGRGDALLCRTVEVMKSLGVGETMIAAGNPIYERTYWDMAANPPACKTISDFFPAALDIEYLYALAIRQGLVETILSDGTKELTGAIVHRPWAVIDTRLDADDPENGPVVATLKSQYGETREIKARYVVGCDGGHSKVRRSLEKYDVTLNGDAHDSVWSAMDVVGYKTDFPDINKVAIVAGQHGAIMIIPREDINGMNCMRFYCELERDKEPSLEDVVATVHKVFSPYKFSWEAVNWFTIYTVAQRIASKFDVSDRIFLAGDAAHLHSPKGGLGMNTSLQDTHNLAVKLALVETGVAKRSILSTYSLERRMVAAHLVHMDQELIQVYAAHGKSEDPADLQKLLAFQAQHFAFQAGTNITYAPNALVDGAAPPHAPSAMAKLIGTEGLVVGRRLLPAPVKRFSDGTPVRILDAAPCDGRFTVFVCVGDLNAPGKADALAALSDTYHRAGGLYARLAGKGKGDVLRVVRVTTTPTQSADAVALLHGRLGLRTSSAVAGTSTPALFDTAALYSDDVAILSPYVAANAPAAATAATDVLSQKVAAGILLNPVHQKWDIDVESGGLVVVRPDGHVGTLARAMDVKAWERVEKYFEGFLVL